MTYSSNINRVLAWPLVYLLDWFEAVGTYN